MESSLQKMCICLRSIILMYMRLADSIDNKFAQAVLKDIADEEVVHAGEFLKPLFHLVPRREETLRTRGERGR